LGKLSVRCNKCCGQKRKNSKTQKHYFLNVGLLLVDTTKQSQKILFSEHLVLSHANLCVYYLPWHLVTTITTLLSKRGVGAAQHFPKINFGTFVFQSLKPFSFLTYLGTLDRVVGGKKSNPQVQTRPQSGYPSSNDTHGRVLLTHST
jgi:hypothetical protein